MRFFPAAFILFCLLFALNFERAFRMASMPATLIAGRATTIRGSAAAFAVTTGGGGNSSFWSNGMKDTIVRRPAARERFSPDGH